MRGSRAAALWRLPSHGPDQRPGPKHASVEGKDKIARAVMCGRVKR
jgi:hypothetical protein